MPPYFYLVVVYPKEEEPENNEILNDLENFYRN